MPHGSPFGPTLAHQKCADALQQFGGGKHAVGEKNVGASRALVVPSLAESRIAGISGERSFIRSINVAPSSAGELSR